MFKWIYNSVRAFFWDEYQFKRMGSAAVANIRSAIMIAGLSSMAFSDQIADFANPKWAPNIKLLGVIISGVAMMFRAGEKNAPPEAK